MLQILLVVSALLVLAVGFVVVSSRTIDSAQSRHDDVGRHLFLRAFDGQAVSAELLIQTHETLVRRHTPPGRPILPHARFAEDLGMGALDVEDAALLVVARCQGRIPHADDLDALDERVRTVRDLVVFLEPFCRSERAVAV